jgi:hypothetical protein
MGMMEGASVFVLRIQAMLERDVLKTTHQGPSKSVDRRANGTKASLTTILQRNKCHNEAPRCWIAHTHTHGPNEVRG